MKEDVILTIHTASNVTIEVDFPAYRKHTYGFTDGMLDVWYYKILSPLQAVSIQVRTAAGEIAEVSVRPNTRAPFASKVIEFARGEGEYASSEQEFEGVAMRLVNLLSTEIGDV